MLKGRRRGEVGKTTPLIPLNKVIKGVVFPNPFKKLSLENISVPNIACHGK